MAIASDQANGRDGRDGRLTRLAVRWRMTKTSAMSDAKKRAQEKVALLKQRLAKQEGTATPDAHAGEDAESTRKPAHVARAQAHPAARTQRPQGRREGK